MWIYDTINQSLLTIILNKGVTARTIWSSLETLFCDNKDARAIELGNELRNIVLGDLTISHYCKKSKVIFDLLANIDVPVPEKTSVTHLINGLSPAYDHIATIIRHRTPLPTVLQACHLTYFHLIHPRPFEKLELMIQNTRFELQTLKQYLKGQNHSSKPNEASSKSFRNHSYKPDGPCSVLNRIFELMTCNLDD